jgi:hypothetical protein
LQNVLEWLERRAPLRLGVIRGRAALIGFVPDAFGIEVRAVEAVGGLK